MQHKRCYDTKHRTELMAYFSSHRGECMTAREIIAGSGLEIGEATVYRLLSKLTAEGKLKRFIEDNSTGARYQFSEEACAAHYHLRCLDCGDTICVDMPEFAGLGDKLSEDFGFSMDNTKTVIYGVCRGCRHRRIKHAAD